jgi:ligand-binding sensor domain-containing protein
VILKKSYTLGFILIFINTLLFPQITDLNFRNYTIADGLPSNETYHVLQDKSGYMWFSTDGGVCRFDGKKMTKYTTDDGLVDNVVFRMAEDSKGRIWFSTLSGKVNYYYNGRIYDIGANKELAKIVNQGTYFFRTMCIGRNDTLYLGSGPSMYYYKIAPDNNYLTITRNLLPPNTRFEIFSPVDDNRFVYSCIGNGKFDSALISTPEKKIHFACTIPGSAGTAAFIKYKKGYLFTNTSLNHELDYIEENGNCKAVLSNIKKDITALVVDKQNNLWVGLIKGGVLFYKDGDLNTVPQKYLSGKTVCNVFEDTEGGMWFTTLEEGIFYTANRYLKTITKPFLKDNKVSVFFVDTESNMLAGTSNGDLYKFSYSSDSLTYLFSHYDYGIRFIAEKDKDYYYLGVTLMQQDKLLKQPPVAIKDETNYPISHLNALFPYSKDSLIAVSSQGLFFMNSHGLRFGKTIVHPGRMIKVVSSGNKELLLGCLNGLWKFKNGKYTLWKSVPELQGRINDIVKQKNGDIWVATDKYGVIRIDHLSGILQQYALKHGLPANKVNAITIDSKENVWIATNDGIAVIDSQNKTIKKYSTANGLLNDQVKKIICCNNELWMGTDAGICICNINDIRPNDHSPNVVISNVSLNNRPIEFKNYKEVFNYQQNNFLFSFDGLSFKNIFGCDFVYRLSGYESTWHTSKDPSANYTNLLAGNYSFIVYAVNNDGVYSKIPAKFMFTIAAPFWKTWWFVTLLIIGWGIFTYKVIRWRIAVFKKRTEEKNKINKQLTEYQLTALQAQMNPHFIFNVITSIQNFILDKDTDEAYDYLAQFARLIRLILQHSKENYISIEKELEMLKLYISLEQLRLNKKFEFVVKLSPEVDTFFELIPVMLIQPYMENAIWHGIMPLEKSKKGVITLSISKQNDKLLISVEDNGVGRKQAAAMKTSSLHVSMAMTLNQKRLELFKAEMQIIDKCDEKNNPTGTKVELLLKNKES